MVLLLYMAVHLHIQSSYTLLHSTIRIPQLIRKLKEYGFTSAALTDHQTMFGAMSFAREAEKAGIKPILGLEVDCIYHDLSIPFLLLAKDNLGFLNLIHLSSRLNDQDQKCTLEMLKEYSDHCFLIVYGEGGYFDSELIAEDRDGIVHKLTQMKEELPPFDVALSYMDSSLWKLKNRLLKRICRSLQISVCAINKIYYLEKEEDELHQILTGIRTQKNLQDHTLPKISGRYLLRPEEMAELYEEEELARTDTISHACTVNLSQMSKTSLPQYPSPAPLSSAQYLTQLCLAGLQKRLNHQVPQEYTKRLKKELDIILEMHYEDYFLIVYDFIREARKKNILVGPGRGSAAGSLVSYCLGITQIDPIKYNLLFERFLNPERITMPDIDTDFPDNRRGEVIDYVYQRYGEDHVANIVTFGTLGARQVLKDVGKVMNIPTRDIDVLTKLVPNTPKITLQDAIRRSPRMQELIRAEKRYDQLIRCALKLEGLPRHTSVHAGGIVFSRLPLQDILPTMRIGEGIRTTQYSMEYLEDLGLIKMDFLGLRNLSILDGIIRSIQDKDPSFNIMNIPMNDTRTFQVFRDCDTVGVFQFESDGMKNLLAKMRVSSFEDIIAALALFRPGPMENIPLYLENRRDPSKITYPVPELKPVLEESYGIMIYQEQVMQTAEIVAGFSLGKADVLRRAISKKNETEMSALRQEFIRGAMNNHYDENIAGRLFDLIEKFAGYGFNKSHAVAYGLIAYQMAYLKANYPELFYCALLNSVIGDERKTSEYIDECRKRGIEVLYPDVNQSQNEYIYLDHTIRLPLSMIKSVGKTSSATILQERNKGIFQDFFDFTARMSAARINRQVIENLIKAGACDCFGQGRQTLLNALDDALNYAELVRIETDGQTSIDLGLVSKPVIIRRKDTEYENSENERLALGFCLGPHPVISRRAGYHIQAEPLTRIHTTQGYFTGFVMIEKVHQHRTKKGDMMAFVKVSDETAEAELTVMPKLFAQHADSLRRGKYILFRGKINTDGSCIPDQISFYE